MPRHRSLWLVALTKTTAAYTCAAPGGTVAELVHALTEGTYDKAVRPSRAVLAAAAPDAAAYARAMRGANVSDELIYLAASLSSISELDETAETFDATGVFSYRWRDARLAFANLSAGGCFDAVDLSPDQFARLWHPDLHWANQIATGRAQPETRYAPAATLASDGTVTATTATTGTFTCELDHGRLPFDTQACALTAGRRLGRAGERFVVDGASLVLEPTVESLYWRFARTSARLEHGFAQLEFVVKRRRYYFFTNVFAPVTAFVVIAGSSFVVDRYASSARVGLCALSLLIMISQIQYRVKIPDVPRPIWLNAYLGGSIYFIMACLLEYSLVSFHVARERSAAARGAAYLAKLLADLRRHHEPRAPRSRSVANVALATPRHARDDGGDGDAPSPSRDEELADLVGRLSSAQLAPARVTFDAHAKGGELGVADVVHGVAAVRGAAAEFRDGDGELVLGHEEAPVVVHGDGLALRRVAPRVLLDEAVEEAPEHGVVRVGRHVVQSHLAVVRARAALVLERRGHELALVDDVGGLALVVVGVVLGEVRLDAVDAHGLVGGRVEVHGRQLRRMAGRRGRVVHRRVDVVLAPVVGHQKGHAHAARVAAPVVVVGAHLHLVRPRDDRAVAVLLVEAFRRAREAAQGQRRVLRAAHVDHAAAQVLRGPAVRLRAVRRAMDDDAGAELVEERDAHGGVDGAARRQDERRLEDAAVGDRRHRRRRVCDAVPEPAPRVVVGGVGRRRRGVGVARGRDPHARGPLLRRAHEPGLRDLAGEAGRGAEQQPNDDGHAAQ